MGFCLAAGPLAAQTVAAGSGEVLRMINADRAILETPEPRKDLACTVTPMKPVLGFDLRFHSGYEIGLPMKELAGSENLLTVIFRVIPESRQDQPLYFFQRIPVPETPPETDNLAYVQGSFDVGEGKYHIDWLLRDRAERYCSAYWDVAAELAPRDKQLNLEMGPGDIAAAQREPFQEEPPVERLQSEPQLSVKVLVNFAPQNEHAATLQPLDTSALVAILRSISREPRIGRFSIIAFNLQEQRVIYRQDDASRIDFPALGDALRSLNLGTVDLKRLSQKHGEAEFLAGLIQKEVAVKDPPDALIFAGPKALIDESVPTDALRDVGEVEFPVFYMNYTADPQAAPWRDAIGRAVKFFKGDEFTISRPRDLWSAMTDIVSKIVRFKNGRRVAGTASQ